MRGESFINKLQVVYKRYGSLLIKIVMIGMVIITWTVMNHDIASAASHIWEITANYGDVSHIHPKGHTGVDFAIPSNTPLKAVVDGTIEKVRDTGDIGYGKSVQIRTDDGRLVIYAHLNDWNVQHGQTVKVGDIIGHSGNTGRSTGPHLHFQVNKGGQPINPMSTILKGKINQLID